MSAKQWLAVLSETSAANPKIQAMLHEADERERERMDRAVAATKAAHEARYEAAHTAARRLTDEQRIQLAIHLVDATDYHAPDLRIEVEGALDDILTIVRGEV